jgi:hypothetical protein
VKEKTKAYMAGAMDAEGCIRLAKQTRGEKTFYSPRIYLSNQSKELMKWAVKHFGGKFVKNVNNGPGHPWYLWYIQSVKHAEKFLSLISPYLKYKQPQAKRLLYFCELSDSLADWEKDVIFRSLKEMKKIGSVTTDTQGNYIKADNAYLAGFFDGEGCIKIDKSPSENTISYRLYVTVTNTHVPSLELFSSLYGGKIVPKLDGPNCFQWVLYGKKTVEAFLLASLPYLTVKHPQALLALEYVRMGREINPGKRDLLFTQMRNEKLKIQSELYSDV